MSDIVEQLLVDADWFGAENARKAATEIKRLRAEVEQWKERYEADGADQRETIRPCDRKEIALEAAVRLMLKYPDQRGGGEKSAEREWGRGQVRPARPALMPLTRRPTGLASGVYQDQQDWTIFEDGEPVGRIYEDASASAPAELRWFWSVVVYVPPAVGIVTSGKAPTLEEAKAQFEAAWRPRSIGWCEPSSRSRRWTQIGPARNGRRYVRSSRSCRG